MKQLVMHLQQYKQLHRKVWVNRSLGGDRPDGVTDAVAIDIGSGFVEYGVV